MTDREKFWCEGYKAGYNRAAEYVSIAISHLIDDVTYELGYDPDTCVEIAEALFNKIKETDFNDPLRRLGL